VFYFPLDFAWTVRAYLRVLRPAALVLMESEIWPRTLHECMKQKIPVAVVNARVSDRSFRRGMKLRVLWGRALRMVSLWLAQSDEDARRLVALGAQNMQVCGNLKYDVRAPKESRIAELIKEAAAGRPVIVAGSTVSALTKEGLSEDELVINVWKNLPGSVMEWSKGREVPALLVLAPRHPERFEIVRRLACEGYAESAASRMLAGTQNALGFEIITLDTVGDLAAVYGVADIAFVGGSLVKRGGHNPLEPAQFGVPVVIGPSYENFRDIVEKMQAAQGILTLDNDEQLEATLVKLLMDPKWASGWGERGRKVFEEQQGATKRAVEAIVGLVKP